MAELSASVDPLFLAFQTALAGRYSIDRELGRGGMGVVYLAREVHLDRLVAIKLLPPDKARDASLRERFLREARLAAKLSHPNIIPIHAVDDVNGFVFYVMAFVDGETLAHRVRTRGPLSGAEGARVLREVAWALAHAHGQGLVHRDVKPDNILIETRSGRVLVADFGIAAAAGDASGDGVSGTPEFMSPEQALCKEMDGRSDIYAFGITAFYTYSARLPFEGQNATEILAKQVTELPVRLVELGLPVPRKVALLIDRCLAKDPAHRPVNAEGIAEQLGVALEERRELPAALRAFVKRGGRLDGSATAMLPFGLLMGSAAITTFFNAGSAFFLGSLAVGATVLPFTYLVTAARRLLRIGFTYDDLAPAFRAEIDQGIEERVAEYRGRGATLERMLRIAATTFMVAAGVSLAVTIAGAMFWPRGAEAWAMDALEYSALAGLVAWAASLSLKSQRRDIDTDFWSSVWLGRVGKLAFAIAKKLLGKRAPATAMTHRATELSLGMAAESLYETLPSATRKALGDLPALLRRLQRDAQALRKRYDALQEALGADGSTGESAMHMALNGERDTIRAKLSDAVGALETIRLNLLRLHAGSGTVEGLTTHIGVAAEVSAEVERMLAAQSEVERVLQFPRGPVPTPA